MVNVVDAKEMVNVVDAAFHTSPRPRSPTRAPHVADGFQIDVFVSPGGEKFAFGKGACLLVVQSREYFISQQ